MELNTIQTEGPWNEIAENINANFRKINLAIENGTGGEGGTVSEELLEQVANNTAEIGTLKTDKYTKPSGGIPVSDLETNVQASLQKADVAIRPNDIYSKTELDTKFGEKLGKEENAASARKIVGFTENPTLDVKIKDGLLEVFKNSNNAQENPTSHGSGLTLLTTQGGFQIAVHNQISSKNLHARVIGFNEAYTDWKELAYIDDLDSKIDKKGGEISGSLVHVVSSTGGDAVGYEYKTKDGERIAGFGAYSHKGELIHTYIGFGSEPWGTYNGLNVGENTFTYKGKAIWYSGQEITESVKISTGSDNKIILNNTDGETMYSFILFMDKGKEYGRLGTNRTTELRWNDNVILDSKNYTTYLLTKEEVQALLDGKQPYIENLTTIIANAEKGATALQPGDVYTKEETADVIRSEVSRDYYNKSEVENMFAYKSDLTTKQDQLQSGFNIKTINGQSLLDGGNINIGNNGVTDVLKVSLDVSSFAVGETFIITDAQLNAILQSRSGYTVVVKDGNNTSEWGQVIGCYFLNIGGGVTFYRITIMHHTNDPQATAGDMVMYNIDVMIQPGNSNHVCKVISVKTL